MKKSVVLTIPRSSSRPNTAASSRLLLPTQSCEYAGAGWLLARISSSTWGEILQPQPAPWLYSVKRTVSVMTASAENSARILPARPATRWSNRRLALLEPIKRIAGDHAAQLDQLRCALELEELAQPLGHIEHHIRWIAGDLVLGQRGLHGFEGQVDQLQHACRPYRDIRPHRLGLVFPTTRRHFCIARLLADIQRPLPLTLLL